MNGDSRDAGKYGNTRADAASVHEFVKGAQAAQAKKAGKIAAGALLGGIIAYGVKR